MTTVANTALGKGKIIGIDKAGVCVRPQQIAMVDGKPVRDSTDARNTGTGLRAAATLARTSSDSTSFEPCIRWVNFEQVVARPYINFQNSRLLRPSQAGKQIAQHKLARLEPPMPSFRAMRTAGHNSFPSDR
jgi:hypothetical protein